jgi:hypothetical protein
VEPLLGTLGFPSVSFDLSLELRNTILGSAKLVRKPLCRFYRLSAVLLGNVHGLVKELQDRLTGLIELTVVASLILRPSRKVGTHNQCLFPYRLIDTIAPLRHASVAPCEWANFSWRVSPERHDHRYMDTASIPARLKGERTCPKSQSRCVKAPMIGMPAAIPDSLLIARVGATLAVIGDDNCGGRRRSPRRGVKQCLERYQAERVHRGSTSKQRIDLSRRH